MIRSRLLAIAAVVVVFGLSACGDPNTTAPLADQPKVIELASGQWAPAGATSAAAELDSKMPFMAPTEFVYDGELPALDGPSASWYFAPGQQPDLERIADLAASLGVVGEVRSMPEDQGGGWAVGPEDYSAAVLTVGLDGMLSWWLSAAPGVSVGYACAERGIAVDPATGGGVDGSSGTAVDAPPPADTPPGDDVVAPDVVAPECPQPQPPAGVPTKDEALAKAKVLIASWGYAVDSYQFDDAYADEWSASVNASLTLDGMKAPIMLSVGFGENGAVTYASGYLAEPQRGADYPTIGTAAGLERLKTQQDQYLGFGDVAVMKATDEVAPQPALGAPAIAPDIAPCQPGPAVDCAPIDIEPVTVTLNSVTADLTMVWAADNTIWLLPAYTFGSADGGLYTVMAVDDSFIQQPDPEVPTTEPLVVPEPAPLPVPGGPDTPTCTRFEEPTSITTPGLDIAWAERWIGLCLSYAESEASVLGWSVRVVREDGVDLAVTADFSDTRFNVAVKGQIITEVLSIG